MQAVKWALQAGYCHTDTAAVYGNEEQAGQEKRARAIGVSNFQPNHLTAAQCVIGALNRNERTGANPDNFSF